MLARTRALDRLRRRTSRRESPAHAQGPGSADAPRLAEAIAARAALASLPEKERRTLELAYYDGLSQREIAEHLETPLGTVKTRTRHGMARLRQQLADLDLGRGH